MTFKKACFVFTTACLLCSADTSRAVEIDWISNSNGDWEVASNWSSGTIPDGGHSVFIGRVPNPQGRIVDVDTDRTLDVLSVLNSSDLRINNNLLFAPDGEVSFRSGTIDGTGSEISVFAHLQNNFLLSSLTLTGSGDLEITNQATLRMAGGRFDVTHASSMIDNQSSRDSGSGGVHGYGTINMNASTTSSVFNNSGRLRAFGGTLRLNAQSGTLDLDGTTGAGQLDVGSNSALILNGNLSDGFDGTVDLAGNSSIDFTQGWLMGDAELDVAASGQTATIKGGTMQMGAASENAVVNVQSGTARFENPLQLFNGTINVLSGSTVDFAGATSINKADALNRSTGSVLRVSGNTSILDSGGTATFDWDGSSGSLLTEVVGDGKLSINVDYIDTLLTNDFNGQVELHDNGGLDVITSDGSWNIGSNGRVAKVGAGVSVIGPSGSEITTSSSGELAVDAGMLDVQVPLTMNGGNMQVAAGGVAELNNLATFSTGAQLTIDGVLEWNLPATLAGITNVGGSGKIVNDGNMTVTQNSNISVATFDWDQGSTLVQPGKTLTIDVNRIDTSNDDFNNNTITVNGGVLDVEVADGEWRLSSGGVLQLTSNSTAIPKLRGDRVVVNGTGEIRVSHSAAGDADADIEAPLTLNEGTQLLAQDFGHVRLLAATTLAGGEINQSATNATVSQNGPLTVTGDSAVNVSIYDWDQNPLTTVEDGAVLDINVTKIDVLGQTFDSNLTIKGGGETLVDLASGEWTLNGTLRMEPATGVFPKLRGARLRVGDSSTADEFGQIVADGAGSALIISPIVLSDHSQISMGADSWLELHGATDLHGNSAGAIAGAGRLRFLNATRVHGDTHIDADVDFTPFADVEFTVPTSIHVAEIANIFQGATFTGPGKIVAGDDSLIWLHNLSNSMTTLESSGHIELGREIAPIALAWVDTLRMTDDGSSIAFDVAGPSLNSNDRLILQDGRLDGSLIVRLDSSYQPALGATFQLIQADNGFELGGDQFDSVQLPTLPGGLSFDLTYSATAVTLEVISAMLSGDFNQDGVYDCTDIDALVVAISNGTNDANFDLSADGLVDLADRDLWLAEAGANNLPSGNAYLLGDADLNGTVDGADFLIWNTNKFTSIAAWCSADFDANGTVDGGDFLLWNANKFTSSDNLLSSVPEPAGATVLLALIALFTSRRSASRL